MFRCDLFFRKGNRCSSKNGLERTTIHLCPFESESDESHQSTNEENLMKVVPEENFFRQKFEIHSPDVEKLPSKVERTLHVGIWFSVQKRYCQQGLNNSND